MAGKKTAAVLLAGGHGSRMRSKTPKQFLLLAGHTVLWHALKALSESEIDEIVLVTPRGAVTRSSRDSLRFGSAARSWFLSTMPRAPLCRRNFLRGCGRRESATVRPFRCCR